MSLALAGVFVGCADDAFVSNNQAGKLEDRPVVGAVSLSLANEGAISRLINAEGEVDWTGMTIGAALMDEVNDLELTDFYSKYTLTDKVWTNYPYTRSENGVWDNDALMVEGNYFYYAPYDAALGRGKLSHTIESVQYAYDNATYTNLGMTSTAPYLRYNAHDKNQLYVGYHGFKAGDAKKAINLTLAPAHAVFQIGLSNEGTEDITIHKMVLKGNFNLATNLDPTNTVNYAYIDEDGEDATESNATLNKRFDLLGEGVIPYTHAQNPVTGAMDYTATSSYVTLVMPNYVVEAGANFAPARVVLPAGANASTLIVDVYTNKGILSVPVATTAANLTNGDKVRESLDETTHLAVGLRTISWNKEGVESSVWASTNSATLPSSLNTNETYQVSVAFDEQANFTVPNDLIVSNTAELEYYLKNWYAGKNAGTTPMTDVNVTVQNENGIAINKAIYDYMIGTANPKVVVKSGNLIIPNDATILENAINYVSTFALSTGTITIAEGMTQTISFASTLATTETFTFASKVINNGTLNVNTVDALDVVSIANDLITNNGTFNIKTPVTIETSFENAGTLNVESTLTVPLLTNGSGTTPVNQSALVTISANNTTITAITNYGKLEVKANVTTALTNETVSTGTGDAMVYTNAEVTVAAGKTLTLNGTINKGSIESEGTIVVSGNFENTLTDNDTDNKAIIKNLTKTSILRTANGATLTNKGLIENSGMIAGASGANIDNEGEMTLKDGSLTLMTNNKSGGEITCEVINNDLQIEGSNAGYVTYTMNDAEEDLSGRNLHINKLNVACSGDIDLTSIFKAPAQTDAAQTVANAWTLIPNIAITSTTASTFTFAEGTILKSLSITGSVDHTIKSVDNAKITGINGFAVEDFDVVGTATRVKVDGSTTLYSQGISPDVDNAGTVLVYGYFKSTLASNAVGVTGADLIISTGGAGKVAWGASSTTWSLVAIETGI